MSICRIQSSFGNLTVWDELWTMYIEWAAIVPHKDGFLSGVLADYMEERIDELLAMGNDRLEIERFIACMRSRFNNRWHNLVE